MLVIVPILLFDDFCVKGIGFWVSKHLIDLQFAKLDEIIGGDNAFYCS